LLLRHSELFAYQFYPFIHGNSIEKFYTKKFNNNV